MLTARGRILRSTSASTRDLAMAEEGHASEDQTISGQNQGQVNIHIRPSSPLYNNIINNDRFHRPGNYQSSVINLTNTLIGTGMLSLPKAFAASGLILGWLTIGWCALTSGFGLYLLAQCAEKVSPGGRYGPVSFSLLSLKTLPRLGRLLDLAVTLKCFGVSVSYLVIIGSLAPKVLLIFVNGDASRFPIWILDRHLYITLVMIILTPFSFLKSLKSLTLVSTIALCAVADFVFLVVYKYYVPPSDLPPEYPGRLDLFDLDWQYVTLLPVQVFAFTCAQNLLSTYNEFANVTGSKMTKTITTSIGIASFAYLIVGSFGYLTFGHHVVGNILEMYPNSLGVSICQLGIVFLVACSYPLQIHPCRASLEKVIWPPQAFTMSEAIPENSTTANRRADTTTTLAEALEDDELAHISGVSSTPEEQKKLAYLTIGLLILTYVVAMSVSKLDVVLGFVGATGSTTISFIIPAIFYIVLFKDSAEQRLDVLKIQAAKGLLIWGIVIMIVSLSLQIKNLF